MNEGPKRISAMAPQCGSGAGTVRCGMAEQDKLDKPAGRARAAARRINQSPGLLTAAKLVRELLPGDSRFGDPLSTAGRAQPEVVGKRLADLTARRPGVLREAGLSALQVWQ